MFKTSSSSGVNLDYFGHHKLDFGSKNPFVLPISGCSGSGKEVVLYSLLSQFKHRPEQIFYFSDQYKTGILEHYLRSNFWDGYSKVSLCPSLNFFDNETSEYLQVQKDLVVDRLVERNYADEIYKNLFSYRFNRINLFVGIPIKHPEREHINYNTYFFIDFLLHYLTSTKHPKILIIDNENEEMFNNFFHQADLILGKDSAKLLFRRLRDANVSLILSTQEPSVFGLHLKGIYQNHHTLALQNSLDFLDSSAKKIFNDTYKISASVLNELPDLNPGEAYLNFQQKIKTFYSDSHLSKKDFFSKTFLQVPSLSKEEFAFLCLQKSISPNSLPLKTYKI